MTKVEARGVRCLDCAVLDLTTYPQQAKCGFGWCKLAELPHFVSVRMARNCADFDPAPVDVVQARDTWAAKILMFWQR